MDGPYTIHTSLSTFMLWVKNGKVVKTTRPLSENWAIGKSIGYVLKRYMDVDDETSIIRPLPDI